MQPPRFAITPDTNDLAALPRDLRFHPSTTTNPGVYPISTISYLLVPTKMDAGKADRYHHAVRWVERARDAYRAAGQEANWQAFKEALLETHRRKYKLIPMLKDL